MPTRQYEDSDSGFAYQERTADAVTRRATQSAGMYDSIYNAQYPVWKPKVGPNLVRVLPPTWDNADHYGFDIYLHRDIGADNSTYLCLKKMKNEDCAPCTERRSLELSGATADAEKLKIGKQVLAWIIDRADEAAGPQLWPMAWTTDRDIAALSVNRRTGKVLLIDHHDKGYDIEFIREGTGLKTRYIGVQISREQSPISDDPRLQAKWLKFITDNPLDQVLHYYPNDYIYGVLMGRSKEAKESEEPSQTVRARSLREEADDGSVPTPPRKPTARTVPVEAEDEIPDHQPPEVFRTALKPPPRQAVRDEWDDDTAADEETDDADTPNLADRTRASLDRIKGTARRP